MMNLPKDKSELKKEYFSWLNKNQESLRTVISDAVDAIYNVYNKKYDAADVEKIKKGLALNHTFCWALGEYVFNFAKSDKIFANLIEELSNHASSKVRLNIITNCLYNNPEDLVNQLLKNALNDKSKKVREKVADVMLRLNKENLTNHLLERTAIETDSNLKNNLLWTYQLLTKKWVYEAENNTVTVHLKDGGITKFFVEDGINSNDTVQIEKKVAELRNQH
ncbi:HEAT repeat domain-containing protein [Flavobacterium sp. CBA20B-1]|uniref:HEAT repeat domain-containing protein n=1 Tax=unclassified Flavobacterium TaxID=196869 RepID=UPI0022257D91|nr:MULTISPECIES: HEAT repeat domain-containing protein [unclassified Flavobacterium]WCM43323.1 HEAT repeat domain-containing protein [Flavobacterium sp. CBA20B-1]